MGHAFAQVVGGGPLFLAMGAAALAGLISFLSPCVLPLIPGYLSYVTGLAGADLDNALGVARTPAAAVPPPAASSPSAAAHEPGSARGGAVAVADAVRPVAGTGRGRVLAGTALFVAGFTIVFVLVAIVLTDLGNLVVVHRRVVDIVVGGLVVVFGLVFLGFIPGLQRELRISRLPRAGLLGAPVLGAVFGLSWAPCVGPTLGAVLGLAVTSGGTDRAALLAVIYCLGLGIPFVVFGLGYRQLLGVFRAVRRNSRWVTRVGGALLIVTGVVMMLGGWPDFTIWLKTTFLFGTDIGTSL
jgi:cytochrome c-type biogenesis protein